MAEIIQQEGGGKKKGKRRAKKHSTHIDMTPMVDLACLLLTFFMLTTAFTKPKIMEIVLPEPPKPGEITPQISGKRALTIILDANDRVFWYAGNANPLKPPLPEVHETDFSKDGIRKVLLGRNIALFTQINDYNTALTEGKIVAPRDTVQSVIRKFKKDDTAGPIVLVKATNKATYGDMVNMVDELTITNVSRYSIVNINGLDRKMIEEYKKSHDEQ
jgi:biopolymer transport protein ExbD